MRATVSGLRGTGLELQLNGAGSLPVPAGGTVTFPGTFPEGTTYAVSVRTQPTAPFQECTVANPAGSIARADVTVPVVCVNTYELSGVVSGLAITRARTPVVLTEAGRQDVEVNSDGTFRFLRRIPVGRAYDVTVKTSPTRPEMDCAVSAGTGTMPDGDLGTVRVSCDRSVGRFAYMVRFPNAVLGTTFAGNASLSTIESLPLGYLPGRIAVDPSGQFLYTGSWNTGGGTFLSSFRIDAATGRLTPVGADITNFWTQNLIAVEPQGRFLMAVNSHGGPAGFGSISVYAIEAGSGQLTEVPGSPFNAPRNPQGLAFDATGRYVYTSGDEVRGYSLDPATGALSPLAGSPFGGVTGAQRVHGTPDGRFLYVQGQSGTALYVRGFRVERDGGLVEFPLTYDPTDIDLWAAMDPKSRFLVFFTNTGSAVKISVYGISPVDGALTRLAQSPGWFSGSLSFPTPAAFDPSGTWLFVNSLAPTNVNSITPGTVAFRVGTADNPSFQVASGGYSAGSVRAIVIR